MTTLDKTDGLAERLADAAAIFDRIQAQEGNNIDGDSEPHWSSQIEALAGAKACRDAIDALSSLPAQAVTWRVDWKNAPRDGTWARLRYPSGDETRLFWSTHYSIHGLGGCWSDGFCTMSDMDFTGWLVAPPSQPAAVGERADALWEQLLPFMQVEECPPGDPYKDKVAALALIEAALRSTP